MRRVVGAALLVVFLSGLTACTGEGDNYDFNFPKPAKIDVDTPKLREQKLAAGVQPCKPGAESGANDLPEVKLPCFGGGPDVELSSLPGPLVVNIWASWCGPCRTEMPALEEFHQQYGDRVPIIGIDYNDPQTASAMELVQDSGVTYPLLADTQEDLLGADPFPAQLRLPMLAFVRPDGSVELVAEQVDSLDEIVDLVEQHTGVSL